MEWSKYNIEFQMKDGRMGIYHTYSNSLIIVEKKTLHEIKNNLKNKDSLSSDFEKQLFNKNHIVESDANIRYLLKYKSYSDRFKSDILNLTIAPTSDCNFACPYCFEESKPQWYMDKETTDNLIKFIKSYNKPVNITWFGGEPLMNQKKIRELTKKIIDEGIKFKASILTNGYLLGKSFINDLVDLGITRVQVTLDGSEEVHNKHRPHKKGGINTFKRIINNLDNLMPFASENNIRVTIPVTVDSENESDYENIYTFLTTRYNEEMKNGALNVTINFVESRSDSLSCKLDDQSRINFFIKIAENKKVDKQFIKAFLLPTQNVASCMMRNINSFGIGPKGNIYKCLEDFTDPLKAIGNINKGKIDFEKIAKYTVGEDVFDDMECSACSMLPICVGGCPYDNLTGTKENYHDNNCSIYKGNMDKVLTKYYSLSIE